MTLTIQCTVILVSCVLFSKNQENCECKPNNDNKL